jgi:hypothetical protein
MTEMFFREAFRVLKPGQMDDRRVLKHSSYRLECDSNQPCRRQGFVVANVSALDKKQGSFKAVTYHNCRQARPWSFPHTNLTEVLRIDLPETGGSLRIRFGTSQELTLHYLPRVKSKTVALDFIAERDPKNHFRPDGGMVCSPQLFRFQCQRRSFKRVLTFNALLSAMAWCFCQNRLLNTTKSDCMQVA